MADDDTAVRRAPLPDDRYGRPQSPEQRRRRVLVAAVVVATLGLAAAVWVGTAVLRVPVTSQDIGFVVVDDTAVDVTFLVDKDPDAVVRCRVRALNPSFAEVGARDVTVGPAAGRSVEVTARVATSERATTGVVRGCTPAERP